MDKSNFRQNIFYNGLIMCFFIISNRFNISGTMYAIGYSYSKIFWSLMCVFFCGGLCVEDISSHPMHHLIYHPKHKTCIVATISRSIKELTVGNTTYTSPASRKSYYFNTADKTNELLIKSLLAKGGLRSCQEYGLDFDHQFIQTERFDAKRT